jgi:single-stranded-DNA-specific exonuclease
MVSGATFKGAHWEVAEIDERDVLRLARTLDVTAPLARILLARDKGDLAEARAFLAPSLADHMHDPREMYGMEQAVDRLRAAIARGEGVRIVSDYDVDGTTASVILQHTLRLLGAAKLVSYHIPSRFDEGYGFSAAAAERAAEDGARLVVTCDIGVRDHAAVNRASDLGIDVIVCDHHLPPGEDVPDRAFAVLCPKQDRCTYPNDELAACGLSLKLSEALLRDHPRRAQFIASLAKIAAIGTIADMVGLHTRENRAIVAEGLAGLSRPSRNHGLNALLEAAGIAGRAVTTADCGFKLGPRINAAGRLAEATTVVELFNADTHARATVIAQELNRLNTQRQQVQQRLIEQVVNDLSTVGSPPYVVLFAGSEADGWHRGVVGIVASRVVELANRPAFIVAVDENGIGRGSARSTAGIHLVGALESCSDILVKFGGHAAAAGFTVRRENIDELRDRLSAHVASVLESDDALTPRYRADARLSLDEVTIDMARGLARLEPHGIGNPKPVFLLEGACVRRAFIMKEKHLKLVLGDRDGRGVEAVWWDGATHEPDCAVGAMLDLLVTCGVNEWQGVERAQLTIKDARSVRP